MHIGLIIWNVEGVLFRASPGSSLIESRIALVRAYNDYGVASTICAAADGGVARERLQGLGLWEEFVLPRFDALGPETLRQHIADLGMTPAQALFVDADPAALQAARALMPDIRILDAGAADADAILDAMLVAQRRPWRSRSDIALLFGEQTRGVSFFSRLRHRIDHDAPARQFTLSRMIAGPMVDMNFPATIVYGAGIDYVDARWPDLANLLDCEGLLEACIQQFCESVTMARARMLVVLPSAGDLGIPTMQLRRRTIRFNAAWRDVAHSLPNIDILDMPGGPAGSALQVSGLAMAIDDWADGGQAVQVKVA